MDSDKALRAVLLADGAVVLGRVGREIEQSLAVLRASLTDEERIDAEYRCADAVWRYFVQREAMGVMSHAQVIETFAIPASVLAKVGAKRPIAPLSDSDSPSSPM